MDFEPLLNAPLAVKIHVATVLPAFVIGAVQFALPKGTLRHRISGYTFMILMVATAIAAFFIHGHTGGRFSYIHLFVPLTLISVPMAFIAIKSGNVRRHRDAMIGLYIGGLIIAGILAFMPGRIMHAVVFG